MAFDTVRSLFQLLGLWPDNVTGAITAQTGRDFIVSAFGYFAPRNPSPTDDSVNTSNIGAWFDTGSQWINTTNRTVWVCITGTPGAAIWVQTGGGAGFSPTFAETAWTPAVMVLPADSSINPLKGWQTPSPNSGGYAAATFGLKVPAAGFYQCRGILGAVQTSLGASSLDVWLSINGNIGTYYTSTQLAPPRSLFNAAACEVSDLLKLAANDVVGVSARNWAGGIVLDVNFSAVEAVQVG